MKKREQITGYLLLLPLFGGFLLFFVIPFLITVSYSLTSAGTGFAGLQNYEAVWSSELFRLAAVNTVRFLLVALPLIMLVSTALSLMLKGIQKGRETLRLVFILPMAVPVASVIMAADVLFAESGLLNEWLSALGLPVSDWLHSSSAFIVLVLLFIWKNCGYNLLLILAGLYMVPEDYYSSARLDGITPFQSLKYITLPMIRPTLLFTLLISFINSFKCFREAFLIGGKYPNDSIYLLQHFMNNNFENINYARLSVAAVTIFLSVALVLSGYGLWRKLRGKGGAFFD